MAKFDPYKTLGVKRSASLEEIKAAYRDLAKKHHPDVEGGSEERFKDIGRAYEVLSDEAARQNFDAFGIVDGDPDAQLRREAIQSLQQMFLMTLGKIPVEQIDSFDLMSHLRDSVRNTQVKFMNQMAQAETQMARNKETLTKIKKRMKAGRKVPNIFVKAIEQALDQQQVEMASIQRHVDLGMAMLDLLENFTYDFERAMQIRTVSHWGMMTASTATVGM